MARLIENNGNGKTAVLDVVTAQPSQTVMIDKSSPTHPCTSTFSLAETLDNISYRIIGLGFPADDGIAAGAVWANEAWGSTGVGIPRKPGR